MFPCKLYLNKNATILFKIMLKENLGFTPQAEILNGRVAMVGFVIGVLTELITGQGVLSQLGLM